MKLFIIGHARHGKDTAAEYLRDKYGLSFQSSSHFAAEHVVRPWLAEKGIHYSTLEACYADRVNWRTEWYNAICDYNKDDLTRLSKAIFSKYDMYVGIRDRAEFLASKKFATLSVWVDAFDRLPSNDPTCKILRSDADVVIDNSTTLEDLHSRLNSIGLYTVYKRGI